MEAHPQDIPLDQEFIEDDDEYKYALFWASGMYKAINYNMRNVKFEMQETDLPNTFWFIKNYLEYFNTHGISSADLAKESINILYRGIRNTSYFQISKNHSYTDNGFIATTHNYDVAKDIAEQDIVIKFTVESLPKNIKFIIIDTRIAEHFHESEILLMPGTLIIDNDWNTTYEPNITLIARYLKSKTPKINMSGGGWKIPKFDIENKTLVFYRAIYNRPLEVIKVIYFPKDASIDILRAIRKTQNFFESMTELIPEFMDLRQKLRLPKDEITLEESRETRMKMNSFIVHIALWNGTKVETLCLFEYYLMFKEMFDMTRFDAVETELNRLLKENLK